MSQLLFILFLCFISADAHASRNTLEQSIRVSKHNLSLHGPGEVKAVSETQICIFCHTPHRGSSEAPLWNRADSGQVYLTYNSPSLKASVGQPSGASKLCLSCHDGTVAIGLVRSRNNQIQMSTALVNNSDKTMNMGINLMHDHPISFSYSASMADAESHLKNPSFLVNEVRLDNNGQVQCTSCHDPHHNDYGNFLIVDNKFSQLCTSCHEIPGWSQSSHRLSSASWSGAGRNPWENSSFTTVKENGCSNCHQPHQSASEGKLLTQNNHENLCLNCHNANVAKQNISTEFKKNSTHPLFEENSRENGLNDINRYQGCMGCHNPHTVNQDNRGVSGAIANVSGVDRDGRKVKSIKSEYELCLKCHGDNNSSRAVVNRQSPESDLRVAFNPFNDSTHPVIGPGKGVNVPSLISPYNVASTISCTDCHNNNNGPNNSGVGPNGPHGSDYAPLLERQLITDDNQIESPQSYALCYKCHSRDSILADQSFSSHREHIVNQRTPCSACHDSHGVKNSAHLINFDRNIVKPNSSGVIRYESTGRFAGRCNLTCHQYEHNPSNYGQ